MSGLRVLAIVLILAGFGGLAYTEFGFTRETTEAKIGPLEISVKENKRVDFPRWFAIGAVGVGVGLLLTVKPAK